MCEGKKKETKESKINKTKAKTILVSAVLDSGPSSCEGVLKKYRGWGGRVEIGSWPIQLHVEQYFVGTDNFSLWDKSRKS